MRTWLIKKCSRIVPCNCPTCIIEWKCAPMKWACLAVHPSILAQSAFCVCLGFMLWGIVLAHHTTAHADFLPEGGNKKYVLAGLIMEINGAHFLCKWNEASESNLLSEGCTEMLIQPQGVMEIFGCYAVKNNWRIFMVCIKALKDPYFATKIYIMKN